MLRKLLLPSILMLAAVTGCESSESKLQPSAKAGETAAAAEATARANGDESPEARIKALEDRVAKLESYREALAYIDQAIAQQKAQEKEQERETPAPDGIFAVDIAADVANGQVEGPASAPVTIVKAFDFACPYCMKVNDTLASIVKDPAYAGKVRIVYKNMVVHDHAKDAHLGSCAAAKQGKYVAFKDAFWQKGFKPFAESGGRDASSLSRDNVVKIAGELGLDTKRFAADMDGEACKATIAADMAELEKFHVHSTPTLYVNGTPVGGAMPREAFTKLIDEKLKVAAASGVPSAAYYQQEIFAKGEKTFRSKLDPKPSQR